MRRRFHQNVPSRLVCRPLLAALALALCAASLRPLSGGEKTPLGPDDVYRFDAPTDVAVSPDDSSAVYARRWIDADTRAERYALWKAEGDAQQARPLETGEPDGRKPVWSPDGKWLAFLSTRRLPDGTPAFAAVASWSDPATDIWLMPAAGGQAMPLFARPKPYGRVFSDGFYGRVAFSPDGKRLVFVADDGADPRTPEEIANQVIIVRDDQGEGYEGFGPAQIWIADLTQTPGEAAASSVSRLTDDDVWYGDPQWACGGDSVVVHANRTADREAVRFSINKNYDLWRIRLPDGALEQLTTGPGPEVSPRFAPSGDKLVCLSVPRQGTHADLFNLLVIELGSSAPQGRVLFDQHGQADQAPHLAPAFPLPTDCWLTDDRFYYQAPKATQTVRQVIDLIRPDGTAEAGDEMLAKRDQVRQKLTPRGNQFLERRLVAASQVFHWTSSDGEPIEGVLTLPPEGVAGRPYKLLVHPHGGPHSRSTTDFNLTVQVLAGAGYAVFQPNFRGSGGYGQRFIDADRGDFGGGDMRDILTGVEQLIEQGIADRERQFVYGVSYGGFMASWLVGHTEQFKAAVAQNAVTDLNAMWGLSDIQSWTEWEFGGLPWQVPDAMRKHSPLTYASQVRTPTLILHAANDRRCPLPMGTMFHRALKECGVQTQMVIYPDERHGIQQPVHQRDVLRRVLDWFARHDPGPAE